MECREQRRQTRFNSSVDIGFMTVYRGPGLVGFDVRENITKLKSCIQMWIDADAYSYHIWKVWREVISYSIYAAQVTVCVYV